MNDGLVATGWPAEWLNGWLAAVGVLAHSDLRLAFSVEPVPKPSFTRPDGRPAEVGDIAGALPTLEDVQQLSIARPASVDRPEFPRKPSVEQWRARAATARAAEDPYLGATVTDLVIAGGDLPHSPFDAAVPKGLTVWERVVGCLAKITDPETTTTESLDGRARRVKLNGLGFDARRVTVSTSSDNEKYVDPVVEVLAFMALPMFPVRGHGGKTATTRGWQRAQSRRGAFTWPVWRQPLTWAALDALLDELWNARPSDVDTRTLAPWQSAMGRFGIFGCYGSVAYKPTGASDTTRAYSSEELWMTT